MDKSREKGCVGKRNEGSRTKARLVVERLGDKDMSAYRCPHCGGWHVGHHGMRETKSAPYRRTRMTRDDLRET